MTLILKIVLLGAAIFGIAQILTGVRLKSFGTAVVVAIVYSLINFLLKGILVFFSLPFVIITLGLFLLVINAFLLWITEKLVSDFSIKDTGTLILAAVLITLSNFIIDKIIV